MPRLILAVALLVAPLAVVALPPGHAHAEDMTRAKERYREGQASFMLGEYLEAARLFEQAFAESKRPQLLWNIAQCYRRQYEVDHDLRTLRRARAVFENYAGLAETAKERAEARTALAEVEKQLADAEQAAAVLATRTPTPTPTPRALPLGPADPMPSESGATPLHRRWWLWTVVGGAVAAGVAVGVGVGLTANARPEPPPSELGNFMVGF